MAGKDLELKLRVAIDGSDASVTGLQRVEDGVEGVGEAADGAAPANQALLGTLLRYGGAALAVDQLVDKLAAAADAAAQWAAAQGRIDVATGGLGGSAETLAEVARTARETHQDLGAVVDLYTSLERTVDRSTLSVDQQIGVQRQNLTLTRAISDALTVANTSSAAAAGALTQLGQGLSSGVLRGDEFNSVAEAIPPIMKAIAAHLGMTTGELRAFAATGGITADVVRTAVLAMGDTWREQAAVISDATRGDLTKALGDLRTALVEYAGESETLRAGSQATGEAIRLVADNLEAVGRVASDAGLLALAPLFVLLAQRVRGYVAAQLEQISVSQGATAAAQAEAAGLAGSAAQKARVAEANLLLAQSARQQAANTVAYLETLAAETPALARTAAFTRRLNLARAQLSATTKTLNTAELERMVALQRSAGAEAAAATAAATGQASAMTALTTVSGGLNAALTTFVGLEVGRALRAWAEDTETGAQLFALLDDALGALSSTYRDLIDTEAHRAEVGDRLQRRYREITEATGVTVTSQRELEAAVRAGTLVFDEQVGVWRKGSDALRELGTALGGASAAVKAQLTGLTAITEARKEEATLADKQAALAIALAEADGREADALQLRVARQQAAARAALTQASAERQALALLQQRLATEREALAAEGGATGARQASIDALEQEVTTRQRAIRAAELQRATAVQAQRLAEREVRHLGDQSEQVDFLTRRRKESAAAVDHLVHAVRRGTGAEEALESAMQEVLDATQALTEAQQAQATGSIPALEARLAAAEALVAKFSTRTHEASEAEALLSDAQTEAAEAIADERDALEDLIDARKQDADQSDRQLDQLREELDLRTQRLENLREEAQLAGRDRDVQDLGTAIEDAQVDNARQIAQARLDAATAAAAYATAVRQAAEADGAVTAEEAAQIAQAEQAAAAKQQQADAAAEAARHEARMLDLTRQTRAETEQSADASKRDADERERGAAAERQKEGAVVVNQGGGASAQGGNGDFTRTVKISNEPQSAGKFGGAASANRVVLDVTGANRQLDRLTRRTVRIPLELVGAGESEILLAALARGGRA